MASTVQRPKSSFFDHPIWRTSISPDLGPPPPQPAPPDNYGLDREPTDVGADTRAQSSAAPDEQAEVVAVDNADLESGCCPSWNDDCSPLPDPCPGCGSLLYWQDLTGESHCQRCHPPTRSLQLLRHVNRIRRQQNLPVPPAAVDTLAAMEGMMAGDPASSDQTPARPTSVAARPLPPAGPCSKCGCPIAWLDAYGKIHCSACRPATIPAAVRRRLIVVGGGEDARWADLAEERQEHAHGRENR